MNKNLLNNTININDNKKFINLFQDNYQHFLDGAKGTEINNKQDVIQVINRKPRSFLTTLTHLVRSFELYNNQLLTYLDHSNNNKYAAPQASKGEGAANSIIQIKKNNINTSLKNVENLNSNNNNVNNNVSKGQKFINNKINELTNTLQNNNLNVPLDLLNSNTNTSDSPISILKYLKTITNSKIKFNKWGRQQTIFNFNPANNFKLLKLTTIFDYAFKSMSCLISKPIFKATPDKLYINLFYFLVPGNSINKSEKRVAQDLNGITILPKGINFSTNSKNKINITANDLLTTKTNLNKLNILTTILSRLFNRPIELDLIRLHKPFFNEHILAKAIGIMSNTVPVAAIIKLLFEKTIMNSTKNNLNPNNFVTSTLAGIKINIGGRLLTQRVIPRISSRTIQRGAIARGKINYSDWSRVVLKNRRGAYSITVTMTHN